MALEYLGGKRDGEIDLARKLLADGFDAEIISCHSGFSIEELNYSFKVF